MSFKQSAIRNPKSAFTLVELLVVITIIGILVALLVPAVINARVAALRTRIAAEVKGVDSNMENFSLEVSGGAYPPNAFVGEYAGASNGTDEARVRDKVVSDFKRFFNKAFPKHREPKELIAGLVGMNSGYQIQTQNSVTGGQNGLGLSPAEAAVFWRQTFSADPRYPLSGEGGPAFFSTESEDLGARKWIGDKPDDSRMGPRTEDGAFDGRFIQYDEPFDRKGDGTVGGPSGRLRINFWQHYPAGSPMPLVYFDASRGMRDINHADMANQFEGYSVYAIKQLQAGATAGGSGFTIGQLRPSNEGKFQVLHAGVDHVWGEKLGPYCYINPVTLQNSPSTDLGSANADLRLYPDGPFTEEAGDTIVNFSDKTTLEFSEP